ncbi:DUF1643 domain-containing protein [Bacillus cereus group sp. Bc253]|uniref:DUF1643 domain-containing protein n=1 Tax=Bacillus cereus group sp. Bc253 TaxID=3018103 RepID=UPI0022DEBF99|nr:DUF1643 domain-containing protein [Bacillus cereus group sp. Bc253]MDA2157939.1 DUF1643 domain-containing protein [Bacillus cereus group sp. Bc253]
MVNYNESEIIRPIFSNKSNIFSAGKECGFEKRELLTIKLNKKSNYADKNVVIIMMNPSKADECTSDDTINKVISFFANNNINVVNGKTIKSKNIKFLNILNLFSIYNSNSECLNGNFESLESLLSENEFKEIFDENLTIIKQNLEKADYIVLAWGMPKSFHLTIYFSMVNHILSCLFSLDKLVYVFQGTPYSTNKKSIHSKEFNPYHPIAVKLNALSQVRIEVGPVGSYKIVY